MVSVVADKVASFCSTMKVSNATSSDDRARLKKLYTCEHRVMTNAAVATVCVTKQDGNPKKSPGATQQQVKKDWCD
jgi:hypothetical protein